MSWLLTHLPWQVLGFTVGTVPWLRSAFIGDSAPLRVVQDSLKLLG